MGIDPETFAMDITGANVVGTLVEQNASNDLGGANIYNGKLGEHAYGGLLPSIIQESILQFGGNYTNAYIDILNQRVLIGKGLQDAADATEANELQISNAFHTNKGSLPSPSTYVAPATPTQIPPANPPVNPNPPLNTTPTSPAAPGPSQPDPTAGASPTP